MAFGGFGCQTGREWKLSSTRSFIRYDDDEILSKTWTNRTGHALGLVDSTLIQSKHFGKFLVVRFGKQEPKEAHCCEIYLVRDVPAEPYFNMSVKDVARTTKPERRQNYLLFRTESGNVDIRRVHMEERSDSLLFYIDEKAKNAYAMSIDDDGSIASRSRVSRWNGGTILTIRLERGYQITTSARLYETSP